MLATSTACRTPDPAPGDRPVQPSEEVAPVVTAGERVVRRGGEEQRATLQVFYSRGSPLLADVRLPGRGGAGLPQDALGAQVAIFGLSGPPRLEGSHLLSGRTRYVVRSHAGGALASSMELLRGARWALLPASGGVAEVGSRLGAARLPEAPFALRGVLPAGITASFTVRAQSTAAAGDALPAPEAGRLLVRRLEGRLLEVGLEILRHTHLSVQGGPGLPELELVLLDPLELPLDTALVLIVPSPFAHPASWGFAMALCASPAPPADSERVSAHLEAFGACLTCLGLATPLRDPQPIPLRGLPVSRDAARTLGRLGSRRPVLLALAAASNARLAADVARSASEQLLEVIARDALTRVDTTSPGPRLGIALEQATVAAMLAHDPLPLELRAILLRFAGGAAFQRQWLESAVEEATSPEAFQGALRLENRVLLSDGSPVIRGRAHAWLDGLELAVPGYDPFAPRDTRRAALRAAAGAEDRR